MQQRTEHGDDEIKERLFRVLVALSSLVNPGQLLFHSHRVKGRTREDKRVRSDPIITKREFILQIKGKTGWKLKGNVRSSVFIAFYYSGD